MTSPASEPVPRPDADFWRNKTLEDLQGDTKPWPASDDLVIRDITVEESDAFWAALHE